MSFKNPILGANGTLIRNSMQSENYVSGVSGWQITRDGDAEFNSVIVRGRMLAKSGNAEVEVTPGVPGVGNPGIRFNPDVTNYVDGSIYTQSTGVDMGRMEIHAPRPAAAGGATLVLYSGDLATGEPSRVELVAERQFGDAMVSGTWVSLAQYYNAGYSDDPAGYPAAFRYVNKDTLQLRGRVRKGTGAGGAGANGFANGDTPLTLPVGFRPLLTINWTAACQSMPTNFGTARLQLNTAGALQFATGVAHAPGWFDMTGFMYDPA